MGFSLIVLQIGLRLPSHAVDHSIKRSTDLNLFLPINAWILVHSILSNSVGNKTKSVTENFCLQISAYYADSLFTTDES